MGCKSCPPSVFLPVSVSLKVSPAGIPLNLSGACSSCRSSNKLFSPPAFPVSPYISAASRTSHRHKPRPPVHPCIPPSSCNLRCHTLITMVTSVTSDDLPPDPRVAINFAGRFTAVGRPPPPPPRVRTSQRSALTVNAGVRSDSHVQAGR